METSAKIGVKIEVKAPTISIVDKTHVYEKALIGIDAKKAYNVSSRIDASISAAHTIASQIAVENAYGLNVSKQATFFRELMLRAESIHSHLSFIHTKIIPKLNGFDNFYDFALKNKKEVLKSKKVIENSKKLVLKLAKRYPHPINSVVGGVLSYLDEDEKKEVVNLLKEILPESVRTLDLITKHQYISLEVDLRFSSLWELDQLPLGFGKLMAGNVVKKSSLDFFDNYNPSKSFVVGPIARVSNNRKLLSYTAEKIAKKKNLPTPIVNPFHNFMCICIETIHLVERGIEELNLMHFEPEKIPVFKPKKCVGFSVVESAKGTIFHKYSIDGKGKIKKARIISNITQNEKNIQKSVSLLPFDPDKKTRKQILDDIALFIDAYYL